jgi:FkbH-like protein
MKTYAEYLKKLFEWEKNNHPVLTQSKTLKIAILRNITIEPIVDVLKVELLNSQISPQIYLSPFDNIWQMISDSQSEFYAFEPQFILLAQWAEPLAPNLFKRFLSQPVQYWSGDIERIISSLESQIITIRQYNSAPIIINNFPPPALTTLGILEFQFRDYLIGTFENINQQIYKLIHKYSNLFLLDLNHIFYSIGFQNAFDNRGWKQSKSPLTSQALVHSGQYLSKIIKAVNGKTKKCLILDCDNTLWGGVIGEDGLNGIQLGPESKGSSFLEFQNEILNLHDRGVILAICSKNNEDDVLEVMRVHPHMQIKQNHLSTWQINWENKASNIKIIAEKLNIGLDSVVFVDDNPYECELVRNDLPDVQVIQLSTNPTKYVDELLESGFFDSFNFTQEDRQKNNLYRAEEERKTLQKSALNLNEFLNSLNLSIVINTAIENELTRISQLTQKTNQFNLTTKRYTEDDIKKLYKEPNWHLISVKLKDKFSDMGLVAICILHKVDSKALLIDTLLMSCRVIGRGVEDCLMNYIFEFAKIEKYTEIQSSFIPSNKNQQVSSFFDNHKFKLNSVSETGVRNYSLNTNDWIPKKTDWFKILKEWESI